jgi:hypothetical protein
MYRHGHETWRHEEGDMDMETSNKKRKQGNFFNPFIICSSCKRKFVDGPFVDEETNGIHLQTD